MSRQPRKFCSLLRRFVDEPNHTQSITDNRRIGALTAVVNLTNRLAAHAINGITKQLE